jgi:cell division protein ZapA (FtsZ GTPase activity inhibitor)
MLSGTESLQKSSLAILPALFLCSCHKKLLQYTKAINVFIVFFLFSFFLLSKVFAINLQTTKQRRFQMNKKVHMRDQAFNQVKDIMSAYKKKPCEQLRYFVKHLFQHYVAA